MNEMDTSPGTGFAIIMAIVLVAVIIYTIIKLRKQVNNTEDAEKRKSGRRFSGEQNTDRDQMKPKI